MNWLIESSGEGLQLILVGGGEPNESLSASLQDLCLGKHIGFGVTDFPGCQASIDKGLDKENTLFIIEISQNSGENGRLAGYRFAKDLRDQAIPLRRIKFYTVGKPALGDPEESYNLVLSLCDYIAPEASPEIDRIMVERWINESLEIQYDKRRLKEGSFLRHSASSALGETIKSLEKYQQDHPDFQIPNTLYFIALQAMLISGNLESEFNKFVFRILAEDILRQQGFCKEFIDSLVNSGRIARALAEFRLGNDHSPILPSKLREPNVETRGNIPFQEMGLTLGLQVSVFIGILVILLKEAIEHTERYLKDNNPKQSERRVIQVYTQNNDKICIKNPCLKEAKPLTKGNNQKITLEVFAPHLPTWQVQDEEIIDGFWIRCLSKVN